jgi:hypothetical protein
MRIGGGPETVMQRQATVVRQLLDANRLNRLVQHDVLVGRTSYPLGTYLDDLRRAIWQDPTVTANDAYRRALQRAHIDRLSVLLADPPAGPAEQGGQGGPPAAARPNVAMSDIRALAREQLVQMRGEAQRAAARAQDRVGRAHLLDVVARIDDVLTTK